VSSDSSPDCQRGICSGYWLSLLVVVLDQVSKLLAERYLGLGQPLELMPLLNFTLAYNTGAAFSFLHDAGGWQHLFFIGIAFTMSVIILVILYRIPRKDLQMSIALWLILGGAIGNLVDRIRIHKVVDFIDFHVGQWHFAIFNIADAAISIGAVLLIMDSLGLRIFRRSS
jgi:signal peptidase II